MDRSLISGLIGGLVAVVLVTYVSARVRAATTDGTLRYGWGLAFLGSCCLAFVALPVGALFYDDDVWVDRGELLAVVGLILGFGLGAIYVFGEYFFVGGTFDDDGIDFHTPWTGHKTEKWRDLLSLEFNTQMNWYVLRFRSGSTIRLSSLLSGHGAVLDKLAEMGYTGDEGDEE